MQGFYENVVHCLYYIALYGYKNINRSLLSLSIVLYYLAVSRVFLLVNILNNW